MEFWDVLFSEATFASTVLYLKSIEIQSTLDWTWTQREAWLDDRYKLVPERSRIGEYLNSKSSKDHALPCSMRTTSAQGNERLLLCKLPSCIQIARVRGCLGLLKSLTACRTRRTFFNVKLLDAVLWKCLHPSATVLSPGRTLAASMLLALWGRSYWTWGFTLDGS